MAKKVSKKQQYLQYYDSLYTKEEQKTISVKIQEMREADQGFANAVQKFLDYSKKRTHLWIEDFLLLNEKYRLLKKHFNLDDEAANKIISKMRVQHPGDAAFVDALNRGRNKTKTKRKP